eukprot:TRINITY_DN12644_c0_g1_i1.p1 TRINITY_DN12644_c0_g1~~TRINITY_DN12644_c0_g1_i1.p1  ORF type:complete len:360 (+),score=77.20 TRINITY_DN12644_c0_g1_i1:22-1101(+)
MTRFAYIFVTLAVILSCHTANAAIGCLDEDGKAVDWWVIIKAPYIPGSSDPSAKSGYGYSYMDANSATLEWTGDQLDTNLKGSLGSTLGQIYSNHGSTSDYGWLMYNDESPDGSEYETYGHTKGDMMFDSEQGFWLVHSVPRFPIQSTGTYSFPENEKTYGQSMLCTTYKNSVLNTIAGEFLTTKPHLYDSNLPSSMNSSMPNVASVIAGDWNTVSTADVTVIDSAGGNTFHYMYKNSEWDSELYEDLVAPTLNQDLYVESWMNGVGPLPSYCTPQYSYNVMDVRNITLTADVNYLETKDHSKWAVTVSSDYVCIGDINRQASQAGRGGGTVCMYNSALWKLFNYIIVGHDDCSSTASH